MTCSCNKMRGKRKMIQRKGSHLFNRELRRAGIGENAI